MHSGSNAEGFPHVARRLEDEDIAVADSLASPLSAAEAHLARARLRVASGDTSGFRADVAIAERLIQAIPAGNARNWATADRQLTAAQVALGSAPTESLAELDSTAGFFTRLPDLPRVLPAVVQQANIYLGQGDIARGETTLARAATLVDRLRATIANGPIRASLRTSLRSAYNRLVMLEVTAGRSRAALDALEAVRATLATTHGPTGRSQTRNLDGPPGDEVLDYALIGDTLLTWQITGTVIRLARHLVDNAALGRTINRVRTGLEVQAADSSTRPDLSALYDELLRPVGDAANAVHRPLVIITDGELSDVPFAALYDSARRRFVVEERPIRFALSLRDAAIDPVPATTGPEHVVLVADPAFESKS